MADNDDFLYLDSHNVKREDHLLMTATKDLIPGKEFCWLRVIIDTKNSKLGKMGSQTKLQIIFITIVQKEIDLEKWIT